MPTFASEIHIGARRIAFDEPTYFIADIAANHDGDLERAKDLIFRAKDAGADCAKFQHFTAEKIVSDVGFKNIANQKSHQSAWKKSVFDMYRQCECQQSWTEALIKTAKTADIEFMTTPYDVDAVNFIDDFVHAYKIGSGDITCTDFLEFVACKDKPVLLACGASTAVDVARAVSCISHINSEIVLMQCNTNYTATKENFGYVNLNVLKTFANMFPGILLGLSDHTGGHAAVLGAVTLGARVVEKHFTDDIRRDGPDHKFAMDPRSWCEMVVRTRELEQALGDGVKRIEQNELETVIIQRRCMRFTADLPEGTILSAIDVEALRPAPSNSVKPYELSRYLGKKMKCARSKGDYLRYGDIYE